MSRKESREQPDEDRRPLVLVFLAALLLVLAAARSTGFLTPTPTAPPLIVWLEGDLPPGLYQFPPQATLADLYQRTAVKAPPALQDLDRPLAPQAAYRLLAGQLPRLLPRMPNEAAPLFFQPLAINSATATQLATIPGIGPKLAARIVAFREKRGGRLTRLEDLLEVNGIGEKKFAVLKENLVLE